MNTESPTAPAKPKRERTQAQKDAHAKRERDRRAAKALAAGNAAETAAMVKRITGKAPASIWQTVTIDGVTIKVADSLSPEQAEAAARKLLAERAEKADAKDVDRVSPVTAAKAAVAARKSAAKLPAGHAKFALSTSAYGVLLAADLDPRIVKALKASDKIRSAAKAANLPYHFPIMTLDDTATCAAVLAATAKDWEKLPSKERGGNLASIKRYAEALREISKGA